MRLDLIEQIVTLDERAESSLVRAAVSQGQRDPAVLTNMVFFRRHPERRDRPLDPSEPHFPVLAREWRDIRGSVVAALLSSTSGRPPPAPSNSLPDLLQVLAPLSPTDVRRMEREASRLKDFTPIGVMLHHTSSGARRPDTAAVRFGVDGGEGMPPPRANIYIGRTSSIPVWVLTN